jgi:hypothetical protein
MRIQDNQSVTSVKDRNGNEVPFYDNGFGPLWLYSSSCGNFTYAAAAVRAENETDAWEIVQDEFLPECDLTMEEIVKEYGFKRQHVCICKDEKGVEYIRGDRAHEPCHTFVRWETVETPDPEGWMENALFQEAYTFRPSGPNKRDVINHGIACLDLNGDFLRQARPEDELVVTSETED